MPDIFLLKKICTALVLPPTGPILLGVLGLLLIGRRIGGWLIGISILSLFLLSSPWFAHGLMWLANDAPPMEKVEARGAQAVVILGGGIRWGPEFGGDTLGRLTLERVRYGAWVTKRVSLPVLVTGGSVYGGTPEAELMRAALEDEFGVKVQWVESQSRNTHENARFSAPLLKEAGVNKVLLVGHGMDIRRASAEFQAAGIEVVPAPTVVQGGLSGDLPLPLLIIPNMSALQTSYYALYELLADGVRRVSN